MSIARMGILADVCIITGMRGCLKPAYIGDDPLKRFGGAGAMPEPHNEVMRCRWLLATGGLSPQVWGVASPTTYCGDDHPRLCCASLSQAGVTCVYGRVGARIRIYIYIYIFIFIFINIVYTLRGLRSW